MTIANDIIAGRTPDFEYYLQAGDSLDDIDEYGFTPIIECAITRQLHTAEQLLARKVAVNKPDVTGRTALHWAVDNRDLDMMRLLLDHGANPNAYTRAGLSVLVYPLLRKEDALKHLLYQYGAKLDFALDFIHAKLLGHRFELKGDMDILNADGEFIELDYEGFILEFTVDVLRDSLRRFTSSYSTRALRRYFPYVYTIMDAFGVAASLLTLQSQPVLQRSHLSELAKLIESPLLILPAASRGHAMCFLRLGRWWAKIDRGSNSLKEGSVNIYEITRPEAFNLSFVQEFLYKKQPRRYFHNVINQQLGLVHKAQIPIASQIAGNCSWANMQSALAVGYVLLGLEATGDVMSTEALWLDSQWVEWDKERALDECIQRFYLVNAQRKASYAAMLGAVLFQTCDDANMAHIRRAEKIVPILTLPEYGYILNSYIAVYCMQRLTRKGNNLLKLLEECGVDLHTDITPIATGLRDRREKDK